MVGHALDSSVRTVHADDVIVILDPAALAACLASSSPALLLVKVRLFD